MAIAAHIYNPPQDNGITVLSEAYVASYTPDIRSGNNLLITMTLTGNITIANAVNATEGAEFTFRFLQDATGGRTISWGSAYRGSNDTSLPSTTSTANSTDYFAFKYNSVSSKADFVAPNKGFL